MSNLSVTEFLALGRDLNTSPLPAGKMPPVAVQNVTFSATPGQSGAFNPETKFIRVIADADCRVKVDSDPTAGSSDTLLAAGQAEYFGVVPGHKISVVEN